MKSYYYLFILRLKMVLAIWLVALQAQSSGLAQTITNQDEIEELFPFAVTLQFEENKVTSNFCSGTLVTPQIVVTAAHCFATNFAFKMGQNNEAIYVRNIGSQKAIAKVAYAIRYLRIFTPDDLLFSMHGPNDVGFLILEKPVSDFEIQKFPKMSIYKNLNFNSKKQYGVDRQRLKGFPYQRKVRNKLWIVGAPGSGEELEQRGMLLAKNIISFNTDAEFISKALDTYIKQMSPSLSAEGTYQNTITSNVESYEGMSGGGTYDHERNQLLGVLSFGWGFESGANTQLTVFSQLDLKLFDYIKNNLHQFFESYQLKNSQNKDREFADKIKEEIGVYSVHVFNTKHKYDVNFNWNIVE